MQILDKAWQIWTADRNGDAIKGAKLVIAQRRGNDCPLCGRTINHEKAWQISGGPRIHRRPCVNKQGARLYRFDVFQADYRHPAHREFVLSFPELIETNPQQVGRNVVYGKEWGGKKNFTGYHWRRVAEIIATSPDEVAAICQSYETPWVSVEREYTGSEIVTIYPAAFGGQIAARIRSVSEGDIIDRMTDSRSFMDYQSQLIDITFGLTAAQVLPIMA